MIVSTSVYVAHPDLALSPTIRALPDAEIGVVSDTGTDPVHDGHVFWVEAPDFTAFEEALAADHTVASFTSVTESDPRRTYRIEYTDAATLITPPVSAAGGLVLESRSHRDGWKLRLELQDHETMEELSAFADRNGIRFTVLELRQTEDPAEESAFGLTEPQIEALVNAYRNGYYDDPREITLEGLSELLGISRTAVSGRLRRGSARLIEEVLVDDEPLDEE
ncbi:helix-turn-helix domain-containing protein [Halopenitus persicus]|uniref:Predicted DNA binding protein, contains HTH domain n=1 Tax=Halopenitus persicus TaxID=1048396 RepID=A0A1H3ES63_9EURY|nr:helix-turn-helix domain-containing protein [Halopenitus persicus]SDX80769.1 Predicted DNA binding protein, contains HTH domain [Halopenitus persicus]